MAAVAEDLGLTEKEQKYLEEHLESWLTMSKNEKTLVKNALTTKILEGRERDANDPYARSFIQSVSALACVGPGRRPTRSLRKSTPGSN